MAKNTKAAAPARLGPEALYRYCDPSSLPFSTTDELEDRVLAVGHERAVEALELAVGIRSEGYNVFVLGPSGTDKRLLVEAFLHEEAPKRAAPSDWCYVNNFDDERRPLALPLPTGRGVALRRDMAQLVSALRNAGPAALEHEHNGNSMAGPLLEPLQAAWRDQPPVLQLLEHVCRDVLEDTRRCMPTGSTADARDPQTRPNTRAYPGAGRARHRYDVNVVVDHSSTGAAPIVYEPHPSLANLVGRINHTVQFGALVTSFTMIRPGALHRANGGYLILDAERVLAEPLAWAALKRALFGREIRIETANEPPGTVSTVALEPEPIPLDVKIVLIGERYTYYLLCELDNDFPDLFKVAGDFENRIHRSAENTERYARLIGSLARRDRLLPLDAAAVARVIEHAARLLGDAEKLTTRIRDVADLLSEASYWAGRDAVRVIERRHVEQALDAQIRRADRMRREFQEEVGRRDLLIDTDGTRIGQINGLSVDGFGNFHFGQPTRITANVRMGDGQVIDIEREIELGGAIHTKGVLILCAYLGARYAPETPLSVTANLVFEQSYGGVEGDSASVAEICALLSALAEVPIRQSLAVTGSINQHGEVQIVGAVNEKIEGFFDICVQRGLTGEQGVLIPLDNVKHLMLRADVVDAVRENRFHVYPIATVDDALTLLTGRRAGERTARGVFPTGSVNHRVEQRLQDLAHKREQVSQQILGKAGSKGKSKAKK